MKKLFNYLFGVCVATGTLWSCTESTEAPKVLTSGDGEIAFEINISDDAISKMVTKADESLCDKEYLIGLAETGDLCANITIDGEIYPSLKVRYNTVTEALIADPIPFALNSTITVEQFTVTNCETSEVLLSAVNETSEYAEFIPQILPQEFEIKDKFQKTPVDIYVLCAAGEDAIDFGFLMWNLKFIEMHCIPIAVNICPDGTHEVGEGILSVQGYYYKENGQRIDSLYNIVESENFGAPGDDLTKICIIDNPDVNNANEKVIITLDLFGFDPIIKKISLQDLLSYSDPLNLNANWNDEFNFLHIDFCDCDIWPFKNSDCRNIRPYDGDCHINYLQMFEDESDTYEEFQSIDVTGAGTYETGFAALNHTIGVYDHPRIDENALITSLEPGEYEIYMPGTLMTGSSIVYLASNYDEYSENGAEVYIVLADEAGDKVVGSKDIKVNRRRFHTTLAKLLDGTPQGDDCYRAIIQIRVPQSEGPISTTVALDNLFAGKDPNE